MSIVNQVHCVYMKIFCAFPDKCRSIFSTVAISTFTAQVSQSLDFGRSIIDSVKLTWPSPGESTIKGVTLQEALKNNLELIEKNYCPIKSTINPCPSWNVIDLNMPLLGKFQLFDT